MSIGIEAACGCDIPDNDDYCGRCYRCRECCYEEHCDVEYYNSEGEE